MGRPATRRLLTPFHPSPSTCPPTHTAADDDMETVSQRYLSAAIKLGRPPNHCVVFAACPTAVTGARRAGCGRNPAGRAFACQPQALCHAQAGTHAPHLQLQP